MLELLRNMPDDVIGVRAVAEVDDDDCEDVLVPAIEDRMAIVTDATSVRRTIKAFGWLIPGDVRVFHLDALETAQTWITSTPDSQSTA